MRKIKTIFERENGKVKDIYVEFPYCLKLSLAVELLLKD